jgi:Zn-dependent protease with chaperone function
MIARGLLGMLAAAALAVSAPIALAQPKHDRAAERAPGARPDPKTDEGGLWDFSERQEKSIASSGLVLRGDPLNAYVSELACRLTPDYCKDIRVHIVDQPVWNAFMMPNGAMAVYTGLLLRMDSEAELGCVVGHEAGHFIQSHSLENFRTAKNRSNFAMLLSLGAAAAGAPPAAGDVISLVTIATLMSYNRGQEAEADRIGFDRIAAAGFDTRVCAGIWQKLLDEFQKSDFRRLRSRAEGDTRIFDSHPGPAERIEALTALAKQRPGPEGNDGAERYRAVIRPHLADWLRADLRRKDFGSTLFFLERRIAEGRDLGLYLYFKGEALRLRRKDGDLAAARAAYEAAAKQPDAPAETWRELGEMYARDKNFAAARAAYETYLQRAPEADDRKLIEADMARLPGGA